MTLNRNSLASNFGLRVLAIVFASCGTAGAEVVFHNGSVSSGGSSEIEVDFFTASPDGALFAAANFRENATLINTYVYQTPLEPPVLFFELAVRNSTDAVWRDFHVDLFGADIFGFNIGVPGGPLASAEDPVLLDGIGPIDVLFRTPDNPDAISVSSSMIERDGENSSLWIFFDNPVDPGEAFQLSFWIDDVGVLETGFTMHQAPSLDVSASCFAVERVKLGTKDSDKCKGIELLEVTSAGPDGELVDIYVPEEGRDKLRASTVVDDGVNGPESIHTSCSRPLDIGDVFGAYTVTDLLKVFDDGPGARGGKFDLRGTFSPAVSVDLDLDDVTFTIDDGQGSILTVFIPAGSFELHGKPGKEKYKFHSPHGTDLHIKAELDFDKCKFKLDAKGVLGTDEIVGTTITVGLQVGENVGQEVVEMEEKKHHSEFKRHPKPQCCP